LYFLALKGGWKGLFFQNLFLSLTLKVPMSYM